MELLEIFLTSDLKKNRNAYVFYNINVLFSCMFYYKKANFNVNVKFFYNYSLINKIIAVGGSITVIKVENKSKLFFS